MNYLDVETFNAARTLVKLCEKIDQSGFPADSLVDACADKVSVVSRYIERRANSDKVMLTSLAIRRGVDKGEPIDVLAKMLVDALSKDKMTAAFDASWCMMQRFTNFYLTAASGYSASNLPVWKPTV